MKPFILLLALASLSCSGVLAQGVAPATSPAAAAAPADSWTEGVIRKVDVPSGQITIRHQDIRNLGMSAMTMVFKAADPALLGSAKPGDKVLFEADMVQGVLTVTAIKPAP